MGGYQSLKQWRLKRQLIDGVIKETLACTLPGTISATLARPRRTLLMARNLGVRAPRCPSDRISQESKFHTSQHVNSKFHISQWLGWHLPVNYPLLTYNYPSEGIRS